MGGCAYPIYLSCDPIHIDVWSGDVPYHDADVTMLMLASREYVPMIINTVGVTVGAELTPLTQLVTTVDIDVWSGDVPSLDRGVTMPMLASRQ